jgi:hypothetical protein
MKMSKLKPAAEGLQESITPDLAAHWTEKLTGRYALAPRELQGKLSPYQYALHNSNFSSFCSRYIETELRNMHQDWGEIALFRKQVAVFGVGLGRGLDFIPLANDLRMQVGMYDLCDVALGHAESAVQKHNAVRTNLTRCIELSGHDGEIPPNTALIVMSQFLQVLPYHRMKAVMYRIARHRERTQCRVIIVHPRNNPFAHWGDTQPYPISELLTSDVVRSEGFCYFDIHDYLALSV